MSVVDSAQSDFPTSWEQYQRGEWPYEVTPLDPDEHDDAITHLGMHEFAFKAEDGEIYAGCYPRAMINNAAQTEQPLMVGASVRGNQAVGILPKERYRHTYVGGRTGEGKSVGAKNAVQQDALGGNGFCFIDPGGEDIIDIVRSLPEYRLDDIIYMEPGNEYREYSIGLNYLDTYHKPGQPGFKKECESIAMNLLPMLNADEYARMKGVASNMLRYLIKANHEDDEYEYTLIDLYYMLGTESAREAYAHHVEQSKLEFLKPYAQKIAELADDDLEPLIRRLQSWVENDVVRPFISQRDSDFSIADAIEKQQIILVKANLGKNERQTVTAALTTKIWSAVTSRPGEDERRMMEHEGVDFPTIGGDDETGEHKPFFLVADEFHAVASEHTDIGEMLAMARKKNLGLYILTQQLSQLTAEQQEQILGNCSTLIAFNPGRSPHERRAIAAGFNNLTEEDLGVDRYTFWTTITDHEGNNSQPFLTYSTPPYPPIRTVEEANEALNRSQKLHGSKRLSDQDILSQVPEEFAVGATPENLENGADEETTETVRAKTCKAVFDQAIREHGEGTEWVRLDVAAPRIRRYLPDHVPTSTTEALWGNTVEQIPRDRLEWEERDGEMFLRCTEEGLLPIFEQGDSQNSAGPLHRATVEKPYAEFTGMGFVYIIPQQGGDSMPDALLLLDDIDILQFDEDTTPKQIHDAYEEFTTSEEYALLNRLSDGETVHIEIEESTGTTAPSQTILNLSKSLNQGRRCLFVCRTEEIAQKVWDHLNDEPRCMRSTAREGCDRYYNTNDDALQIGGNTMYRPDTARDTAWFFDNRTGEIILSDSDGEDHARFDSPEEVFSDPTKYPAIEGQISDYDDWKAIKPPAIPERMFDGEADPEMWDILVTTDDDAGGLSLYQPEGAIPLDELVEHEASEEQNPLADF